jgi:putative acetyltransferase
LLRAAGQAAISLVALSDGRLVGHVLFSPVSLVPAQTRLLGLGLAPLAVLPEFEEQGIGSQRVLPGRQVCRDATSISPLSWATQITLRASAFGAQAIFV